MCERPEGVFVMPNTFRDLPPDHPIFQTGPSFVFKDDPPDVTPAEDDSSTDSPSGERGRMSEQSTPPPDEEEVTILVGGMTREEFLGESERIDFLQPPRPDTALSDLWNAYEDELAGVVMVAFSDLRNRVSRGDAPLSRSAAIDALNEDLRCADDRGSSHDARLIESWIRRLGG
jgi:hypothetical protein